MDGAECQVDEIKPSEVSKKSDNKVSIYNKLFAILKVMSLDLVIVYEHLHRGIK